MIELTVFPNNEYSLNYRLSETEWKTDWGPLSDLPGIPETREMQTDREGGRPWKQYVTDGMLVTIFPTFELVVKKTWRTGPRRKIMVIGGDLYLECSHCHIIRREDNFTNDAKGAYGKEARCKICRSRH